MSTEQTRRRRTTLVKNKQEILEGRNVIDLTDERLAARRREDYETTLGQLSSIHQHDEPGPSGLWHRLTRRGSH
jgi:hypothetical protein